MSRAAYVFPGQGSQSVGMGVALAERYASSREVFEQASQVLGWDMLAVCREGPEEKLRQTDVAQPALYTVGYAAFAALKEEGVEPEAVAGHSIGEYAALAAANVFGFGEGLALVRERGRLMQEAAKARPGSMAAVLGLSEEQLSAVCRQAGAAGVCVPVNFNSPEQIVMAGEAAAVGKAVELAQAAGAKRVIALNVSGAFHSPLMEPAAAAMRDILGRIAFKDAAVPVAMNVDGQLRRASRDIQDALARQLDSAVRWVACVESLQRENFTIYVECGAGKVLCGLIKRIQRSAVVYPTETPDGVAAAASAVRDARKGTAA